MFSILRVIQWDIAKADHASVTLLRRHLPSPESLGDYSAWQTASPAENGVTLELSVRHKGENPLPTGLGSIPSSLERHTHG